MKAWSRILYTRVKCLNVKQCLSAQILLHKNHWNQCSFDFNFKAYEEPDRTEFCSATVEISICKYRLYYQILLLAGRTMNTSEILLRWEASLCHLDREPKVYHDMGDHVTGLLSDRLPQTCEPLFPPTTSFAASVMFIHRILPSGSPRLNVIGQYTDCSPITGLWMFAMGDLGVLQPCASYDGVDVGDLTVCRYRCDTDGLVNYIVVGISERRALAKANTAVICDITLVWAPSRTLQ